MAKRTRSGAEAPTTGSELFDPEQRPEASPPAPAAPGELDIPPAPPPDPWAQLVATTIAEGWGRQAFRNEAEREEGVPRLIAKLRADLPERCAAVAELLRGLPADVPAIGEQLSLGEYSRYLREPLHRLLPVLDPEVRDRLAGQLVTLLRARAQPEPAPAPEPS